MTKRKSRNRERASGHRNPHNGESLVAAKLLRPRVSQYLVTSVVPVFADGESGPPGGSMGEYHVVFVLGVPGVSSVVTALNFEELLRSGNSLLRGTEQKVQLSNPEGAETTATIVANSQGRLARIQIAVAAASFDEAEKLAYDLVMPILSRLAFAANTGLEIVATVITEAATQIRQLGATIIGQEQPTSDLAGLMTPELRPLLATYREGLNSHMPLYQALSLYKVIEHVEALSKQRQRSAKKAGADKVLDPFAETVPVDSTLLPVATPWESGDFEGHLGRAFSDIKAGLDDTIRNAVAHLTPGREVLLADRLDDIRSCRAAVPILRYMAHRLIEGELSRTRA